MIHSAIKRFLLEAGILAVVICACVATLPTYLHAHAKAMKEKAQATSVAIEQRPNVPNPVRLADRMLFEKLFSATKPSSQPPLGGR